MIASIESVKRIITKDLTGRENGFLQELLKDGDKTLAYLTTITPGGFKGYHLHRRREANYIVVRGRLEVQLYRPGGNESMEHHVLIPDTPIRFHIPTNVATGLQNIGNEDVWLINLPNPPYDPNDKDEQVEYTLEELTSGVVK